jgi:uncharacterized protein YqhQ
MSEYDIEILWNPATLLWAFLIIAVTGMFYLIMCDKAEKEYYHESTWMNVLSFKFGSFMFAVIFVMIGNAIGEIMREGVWKEFLIGIGIFIGIILVIIGYMKLNKLVYEYYVEFETKEEYEERKGLKKSKKVNKNGKKRKN